MRQPKRSSARSPLPRDQPEAQGTCPQDCVQQAKLLSLSLHPKAKARPRVLDRARARAPYPPLSVLDSRIRRARKAERVTKLLAVIHKARESSNYQSRKPVIVLSAKN